MEKLSRAGTVRVGTKFDQPLFGQKNPATGEIEGFDVEIAKIIARELGIEPGDVVFVETASAVRETFIQQGKVDYIVATYTINDERKNAVSFAGPYYVTSQDLMVARGNPRDIEGVHDLNGTTVCSVEGTPAEQTIQQASPDATIILFKTYSECAEELRNGKADAVLSDSVILLGLMSTAGDEFELVGNSEPSEEYGIGIGKGDDEFRDFINDILEKAYQDGRWEQAYKETVGEVAEDEPSPPPLNRY